MDIRKINVAIDIDNTITKNPLLYKEIMLSLMSRGNKVYVLTVATRNKPTRDERITQLNQLSINDKCYDELLIADGESISYIAVKKGELCVEYGIDLFIDDYQRYLDQVRSHDSSIVLLKAI